MENNLNEEPAKRRHHRSHRSNAGTGSTSSTGSSRKRSSFETIVAKHLLKIIGILFFVAGGIWFIFKSDTIPLVAKILNALFTVVEGQEHLGTEGGSITFGFSLYLLPGILFLTFAYINKLALKGKEWLTLTLFFVGAASLYFAHLFENFYALFVTHNFPYSSLSSIVIISFLIAAPIMYFTKLAHKSFVHIITIAFMYLNVIFIAFWYGSVNHELFLLILTFSVLMFIFSGKHSGSTVNTTNAYFAFLYFGLFFLRKLYIKDNPDLVWFYFAYATMLYLVIMVIRILKPYQGTHLIKKIFSESIIFLSTAFYFVSVWYIFRKYGYEQWQWVFASFLTILNYALLRLNRKLRPEQDRMYYYYSTVLVAASLLPLLVQHNRAMLYSTTASILFIYFAKYRKNQFAALLSVVLLTISTILLLVKIVVEFYPAVYYESKMLPFGPFMVGLISGLVLTLATFLIKQHFVKISFFSYSQKWFSKSDIGMYISALFYASLYLTSFWLVQYLFFSVWNIREAHLISWYAFHITFLLLLQMFVLESKSWVYKPFLWISVVSLIALPVGINFFIISLRDLALSIGGAANGSFIYHFVAIIPLVGLLLVTTVNINETYYRFKERTTWIMLFRIVFFVYLFLTEYDHFTVITGDARHYGEAITQSNKYLPYTIVFYLTSLVLVLFSFMKNLKLLRQLSLLLLLFTTFKVFVLDFASLNASGQAFAFWLVGGFILLYSFIYQQLRKFNFKSSTTSEKRHHKSHRKLEDIEPVE